MMLLPLLLALATPMPQTVPAAPLLTWGDLLKRPRPAPDATLTYGEDDYQKVDVWRPAGKGPFPVVVMVHGGCWQTEHRRPHPDELDRGRSARWRHGGVEHRLSRRRSGGRRLSRHLRRCRRRRPTCCGPGRRIMRSTHAASSRSAIRRAGISRCGWRAAHACPKASPLRTSRPLKIAHVISLGGLPDLEATAASPDNGCGTDVVARLVGTALAPTPMPTRLSPGCCRCACRRHW